MKSLKFLRTLPGAALAVTIVATSGVGAYALTNWFNGDVTVTEDASVLTVDLSQCKGSLPPGVDNPDRHHVQFKILGNPHITATRLRQQLLAECERNAVNDFYQNNPATAHDSLYSSTVKAMGDDGSVTLDYFWGGTRNDKTFQLAKNSTVYNQGKTATPQDLHVGDTVVFVVQGSDAYRPEGTDPLANTTEVLSIFKTRYNTNDAPGAAKKDFYDGANIMTLDWYNQIHR